jgi:hypothetical protein
MLLDKRSQTEDEIALCRLCGRNPARDSSAVERLQQFEPADAEHRRRLRDWCRHHWPNTVRKARGCNAMAYHRCCSSFSRRGFKEKAGHPALETVSLFSQQAIRRAETAEDFCEWLLAELEHQLSRGLPAFFPAINRRHVEPDDASLLQAREENARLRRRLEQAEGHQREYGQRLKVLEEDKLALLRSSRAWYDRYQRLLAQLEAPPADALASHIDKTHANSLLNTIIS